MDICEVIPSIRNKYKIKGREIDIINFYYSKMSKKKKIL